MSTIESERGQEENGGNYLVLPEVVKKGLATLLVASALSGPMAGKVRAGSNQVNPSTTTSEKGVMPSQVEAPTPTYAERLKVLASYKEELQTKECKPENLDFCSKVLYDVDFVVMATDPLITKPAQVEASILKNHLLRDKVIDFGKTGEGLEVIYFKDKNGKKTKDPALCYVGAADWNVGLKQVQTAIDKWEKDAPNFLRAMYNNDVCVFFQSKIDLASGPVGRYKGGIILFNCDSSDKKKSGTSDFVNGIMRHLGVEMFGNRTDVLGKPYLGYTGGAIKQILAVDCNRYLYAKTKNKFYKDRVESYQMLGDRYLEASGVELSVINSLISELKANNWITPYGAETWEEIDSVKKDK